MAAKSKVVKWASNAPVWLVKWASNAPVWLVNWASSINSVTPLDDVAQQVRDLQLQSQLSQLLLSKDVCARIAAADRDGLPDSDAVRADIEKQVIARDRARRRAMHSFLFDAALLSRAFDYGDTTISAAELRKEQKRLAKRCEALAKSLRAFTPFLPSSRIDRLESAYRERQEHLTHHRQALEQIVEQHRRRKGQRDVALLSVLQKEAPPIFGSGYAPGFNLAHALSLYAELLLQNPAQPARRRRVTGKYAKRNAILDLLIITSQKKYFRKLPNSLLAAIAAAVSQTSVSESVVRARAATLRK